MPIFSTILAAAVSQAVPVDENFNIPQAAGAHAERLEELYDQRDYRTLSDALFDPQSQEELTTGLDWLGMKYRTDGSSFISFSYSRLLEAVAGMLPPDQAEQFRGTALAALVQSLVVARIDAQQCDDATARGVRSDQLLAALASSPLRQMEENVRRNAAFIVTFNEEMTWTERQVLDQSQDLCTGGMLGMIAGMTGGTMQEREAREGEIGRQIEITPPDGFAYGRRPAAEWLADAERVRQTREAMLLALLDIDSVPTMEEVGRMMGQPSE